MLHRNSQKRIHQENSIYFIVTKTYQNFPYFKEQVFCDLFIEDLKICKELKKFKLYGSCLIYDHLNLLIHPDEKFNILEIMQFLKRHISRDINYVIGANGEGDIRECRLRDGEYNCFSDIINSRDKNLKQFKNQFLKKYNQNQSIIPKFKWQKSFHDHVIRDEKDFENHYNYTIYNFQKHNLPNDWKYTSLNYEELADGIIL